MIFRANYPPNSKLANLLTAPFLALIILLTVCLPGCSAIQNIGKPEDQTIETLAAQTISAGLTMNAPTITPTLTRTPRPPRPSDTPTQTATITPTLTPQAILRDDFSAISGWGIKTTDGFSYGYANGGYRISVDTPFTTVWSTRQFELTDVHLEVTASQLTGPENGFYGLTCRQQIDGFNYYVFVINPEGFYAIGKVVEGTLVFIQEGTDQANIIQSSNSSNRISADCIAQTLALYVNGQKLLQTQDSTFKTGFIGLVAGIQGMGIDLTATFDDFFAGNP